MSKSQPDNIYIDPFKNFRLWMLIILPFLFFSFAIIIGFIRKDNTISENLCVVGLFVIPFIFQIAVIFKISRTRFLQKLLGKIMVVSNSYIIAWVIYEQCYYKKWISLFDIISIICMVLAFVLVGFSLHVSHKVMLTRQPDKGLKDEPVPAIANGVNTEHKPSKADKEQGVVDEIRKNLFWVLGFFLSVFLCIAYLITFAFAFNNESSEKAFYYTIETQTKGDISKVKVDSTGARNSIVNYEDPKNIPEDSLKASLKHVKDAETVNDQKPKIEGHRFKLLDYIYFTIYTITTSSYGDIIPVTAYTKFLTSIANIFELIFTIIFFNVLLAASTKQRRNET
jgi:hypothetical protein